MVDTIAFWCYSVTINFIKQEGGTMEISTWEMTVVVSLLITAIIAIKIWK